MPVFAGESFWIGFTGDDCKGYLIAAEALNPSEPKRSVRFVYGSTDFILPHNGTQEARAEPPEPGAPLHRHIIVGRNSTVWNRLKSDARLSQNSIVAISHSELSAFRFEPSDQVWVFSYSRNGAENLALLSILKNAAVERIVYISSSSVRVMTHTDCYEYPRVKQSAELAALAIPNARVLTLGLVYGEESELPGGTHIGTSLTDIVSFFNHPVWPAQEKSVRLFKMVTRPFGSRAEKFAYQLYGWALQGLGRYPCILRPVDLLLRALGVRWYGYTYLSTRLWTSTIS